MKYNPYPYDHGETAIPTSRSYIHSSQQYSASAYLQISELFLLGQTTPSFHQPTLLSYD